MGLPSILISLSRYFVPRLIRTSKDESELKMSLWKKPTDCREVSFFIGSMIWILFRFRNSFSSKSNCSIGEMSTIMLKDKFNSLIVVN